jgi:hypothetical protein
VPRWARRLCFWVAVGLTGGVVTPFTLEALNTRFPHAGFNRLLAVAHRGPENAS